MRYLSALCLRIPLVASICSLVVSSVLADATAERKAAAERVAGEITRHHLHKIYVADFLVGVNSLIGGPIRMDKGCYFSSVFSTNLSAEKSGFEVLNRIKTQRFLTKAGIAPADLFKSESAAKISAVLGVDAVLVGTFKQIESSIVLELSLRDGATGKELYHAQYQEQSTDEFEALFPAATGSNGSIFYFANLDGVGPAECLVCSNSSFTRVAGEMKIQGTVLLSAVFTVKGRVDQARVIHGFNPNLDQRAMEVASNWKVDPSLDASGVRVPVRQQLAVDFAPFNTDAGRFVAPEDIAALPRAGVNGFGSPVCVYCPQPAHSDGARADQLGGTVLLEIVVTPDGQAINAIVLKGPGGGLEEQAMKAVKSWKFRPATDSTGKAAAVRVQIEITYHFGS